MNNSVQENFTESFTREHKHLNPLNILIGDQGFHVLCVDKINSSVYLLNQRAVDFILILQIGIGIAEKADLDVCAGNPTLRVAIESQHGGASQVSFLIDQMQIFQ